MSRTIQIIPRVLRFKRPAGTSRGIYTERKVWYVVLTINGRQGIGECAPLPDLSIDASTDYERELASFCRIIEQDKETDISQLLNRYPSMLFGLETAIQHANAGSFALWDTPFSQGKRGIPTNGLIWMDSFEEMSRQIERKIEDGFHCIKLKIGAIEFEQELSLIRSIRSRFKSDEMEIRVDANGAFTAHEAMEKLSRLAELDLHSIEQPIRAGQWETMASLCASSPLPIALDEELIGVSTSEEKQKLLETIRPRYIILKPSLHGGISGCGEWIDKAGHRGIGWWITSALESNIGLNAIAQWCATLQNPMPQGLGTGALFERNIDIPISIQGNRLWYAPDEPMPSVESIDNRNIW